MSATNDGDVTSIVHTPAGEIKNFQVQVGSKLFPEYPIRSHAEAYYQLQKTLGVQASELHSFDISAKEYRDSKCIIGIDTEKMLSAGFSGLNTRSGDLMRIRFEANNAANAGDSMHIVLHSDQILEVSDTGIRVVD